MPSLMDRISQLAPTKQQGRQLIERARGVARAPATRRKIAQVRSKLPKRR